MGTYYYIVCHDCKVEQAAASTSCGNSPGGLANSDTHLLPFIVEHAGHNTQCLSEHVEGPHEEYPRYEIKPEWQGRVAATDAKAYTEECQEQDRAELLAHRASLSRVSEMLGLQHANPRDVATGISDAILALQAAAAAPLLAPPAEQHPSR